MATGAASSHRITSPGWLCRLAGLPAGQVGFPLREAFPIYDQWRTRAWFTVARAAAAHTKSFVLSHSLFTCPT